MTSRSPRRQGRPVRAVERVAVALRRCVDPDDVAGQRGAPIARGGVGDVEIERTRGTGRAGGSLTFSRLWLAAVSPPDPPVPIRLYEPETDPPMSPPSLPATIVSVSSTLLPSLATSPPYSLAAVLALIVQSSAFLAMAHQALGHAKPAREWLGRFEARFTQSSLQWNFWQQISRENLLAEARAKIVFDPVFPADPFAGP
jgi:hypothetical protein